MQQSKTHRGTTADDPVFLLDGQADHAPGPYYVSMVDGSRIALLAGPFPKHQEALMLVDRAAVEADKVMPGAWFYKFGTVRMQPNFKEPGKLNERLGLIL